MLPTGSNITFNSDDEHPSMFSGEFRGPTEFYYVEQSDNQVAIPTVSEFIAGKNSWSAGVWSGVGSDPTTGEHITSCSIVNYDPENEWFCR